MTARSRAIAGEFAQTERLAKARPWLKVTHLATFPGVSRCSNFPHSGTHEAPGRWVVFDKDRVGFGPVTSADVVSDHSTFEEAARACSDLLARARP